MVVELLARPQLTDLPEHPVGECWRRSAACSRITALELGEIVDLTQPAPASAADAIYVEASELHRIDDHRILRYDLTLPLLLDVRYTGAPLRLLAAGKAYRRGRVDATHLEAFHQAEVFSLDTRANLDPWRATGRVLQSIEAVLPGRSVQDHADRYAMCSQAWELDVDATGGGTR